MAFNPQDKPWIWWRQLRSGNRVSVIIPALNEENAIGKVLDDVPKWVDEVVVVDNGSTDETTKIASGKGARVVSEPERGYGSACLKGIDSVSCPEIVVFLDGDYSDYPEEMDLLVDPILDGEADMVIGSRITGDRGEKALTELAIFGNKLTCSLLKMIWGQSCTDLGPFRAISYNSLIGLKMTDRGFGWTVEMQIKAAKNGLKVLEVPVSYRERIGESKISGNILSALRAGVKIMATVFRYAFWG
jgi:glycosyltransferase involved in cell wall biosynthesis